MAVFTCATVDAVCRVRSEISWTFTTSNSVDDPRGCKPEKHDGVAKASSRRPSAQSLLSMRNKREPSLRVQDLTNFGYNGGVTVGYDWQ